MGKRDGKSVVYDSLMLLCNPLLGPFTARRKLLQSSAEDADGQAELALRRERKALKIRKTKERQCSVGTGVKHENKELV
jgi:hypothetical protein